MTVLTAVAEQFEEAEQQYDAATLGMWVFLATEVLFFGVMFGVYSIYRYLYGEAFEAAGSHMARQLGTVNTGILLTSSLTAAMAVHFSKENSRRGLVVCCLLTAAMGIVFDALKAHEYVSHYHEHLLPGFGFQFQGADAYAAELFYVLYYVMTGIHALHVAIGVVVFLVLAARSKTEHPVTIANAALYWHFVDIVWIFLYPLYYLIGVPA